MQESTNWRGMNETSINRRSWGVQAMFWVPGVGSYCQNGHNQTNSHVGIHSDSKVESTLELSFYPEEAFDKSRT